MNGNPNAVVASGSTGVGVLAVWLLGHFGIAISAEIGAVIAGGAAAVVLFIGRNGLRGAFRAIWRGSK